MSILRHHVLRRRWLAAWLIAMALLMKMAVPSGYMLGISNGAIGVELCPGFAPPSPTMAMTMNDMGQALDHDGAHHGEPQDHGKAEQPCAFAGLTAPALAGADPLLLAMVVAFIIATAFRVAARPLFQQSPYLRPPLRGPPIAS